jgi:glycosyltransferase involved in cell wall biosynthesis
MMNEPVGISILTNGERLPRLAACVSSILGGTSYRPLIVAVHDNGSVDGTSEWLREVSSVEPPGVEWRVGRSETDMGVSVGTNRAMDMVSDCGWAMHVESDFELLPPELSGWDVGWLDSALRWMSSEGCDYLYLRRIVDEREVRAHWWWRWPGRVARFEGPFCEVPGFWWSNNPHLRNDRALRRAGVVPIPERDGENKRSSFWSLSEARAKAPPNPAVTVPGLFVHEWDGGDGFGCGRFDAFGASSCKYGFFVDPASAWCRACDAAAPSNCLAEHVDRFLMLASGRLEASVATVWVDREVLHGTLAPSLEGLRVERLLARGEPWTCLASEYNRLMDSASCDVVVFVEPDVEFSRDAFENVVAAVRRPDVGAAGLIGAAKGSGEVWSRDIEDERDVDTLDACVLAVDRRMGFRFDDRLFPGLHLHVEDYCCQARAAGSRCVVVPARRFEHHSTTWSREGPDWGDYSKYKAVLLDKWRGVLGEVVTT